MPRGWHLCPDAAQDERKDWVACLDLSQPKIAPRAPLGHPNRALNPVSSDDFQDASLNLSQAELLHHFNMFTASSLVSTKEPNHPVILFWKRNAPQLGFSQPYLLHMALSLAAQHRRRLSTDRGCGEDWRYLNLASRHMSLGIASMNKALAVMDSGSCGALLVSSMLVCSCTFAAGPTGPDDLLLCGLGTGTSPRRIQPLISGVRLIEQSFDAKTLYSGLLKPLDPVAVSALDDLRPSFVCLGFPRIEWSGPLETLRKLVAHDISPNALLYDRALTLVEKVYEAVYGNDEGIMECPTYYKMILIFIYFAEDQFVTCLTSGKTLALVILTYYAPPAQGRPQCVAFSGLGRAYYPKCTEQGHR